MYTLLGVILARAGSKGLPGKCMRPLRGRPVIQYTFDHARASRRLTGVLVSTDCPHIKALASEQGIDVVDRPAELAHDTATVDAAARHAVLAWEERQGRRVDQVALLYGNIPLRPADLTDRAASLLTETNADSVRSVTPVGKYHPDWMYRIDGSRMSPYRPNSHYRRQDLEPLFGLDGAMAVVTRTALFGALESPEDRQAFLGADRRAIVLDPTESVDIDEQVDLFMAEAMLRWKEEAGAR